MKPTAEEIDRIQLREEEVQEILSRPPRWLVRWGTTMVFAALALLIGVAWWLQYPDLVMAPVVLTTPQPPVAVVSPKAGNLRKLLVADNDPVQVGQRLAIIKSQAKPEAIFELEKFLAALPILTADTLMNLELPQHQHLGELQTAYSDFVQYLENYQLYLGEQTELKKIPFLKKEMRFLEKLTQGMKMKDSTLLDEIQLLNQNLTRQKEALKLGGTIAEKVETIEQAILLVDRKRSDINLQILDNFIAINDLQTQVADIRQRTREASKGQFILVKESLQRLKAQLQQWLDNFVLVAPIEGRVAFYQYWSEKQYVAANSEVFTIVPESNEVTGKLMLPVSGSGKVEVGQKVNIKLAAFPYREYGIVEGTVDKIALVAKESTLMVDLHLPNNLKTTYNKTLPFYQQMQGTAEIITKERRLLMRFLDNFLTGE